MNFNVWKIGVFILSGILLVSAGVLIGGRFNTDVRETKPKENSPLITQNNNVTLKTTPLIERSSVSVSKSPSMQTPLTEPVSTSNKVSTPSDSSSSKSSDDGKLTTEKAQNAINKFASLNGNGRIRIKDGVQEIPALSEATAELNVDDFTLDNGENYKGQVATATFTHYTDGRWVLTKIEIMQRGIYGLLRREAQISVQ